MFHIIAIHKPKEIQSYNTEKWRLYVYLISGKKNEYLISGKKKASTIQFGYRKCGTHARVFCQTLAHGNSRMKEDKETEEDMQKRVKLEKSKIGKK